MKLIRLKRFLNLLMAKIGFGGGCHWCTEAVFASLRGVLKVNQGWIASQKPFDSFSEAVEVEFDEKTISLSDLVAIHLFTHASTSNHDMRDKYRSAVYFYHDDQSEILYKSIKNNQRYFERPIVTKVLPFGKFKWSKDEQLEYYYSDPSKAFCTRYINPKLEMLLKKFSKHIDKTKVHAAIRRN